MVQIRKKLKRCIPLLLALIVLICSVPVFPALAANPLFVLSGAYKIVGDWSDLSSSFTFLCEGFLFDSGQRVDFNTLWGDASGFYINSDEYEYNVLPDGTCDFDGVFYVTRCFVNDPVAVDFFTNYAVQVKYTLTFDLAGGTWSDGSSGVSATGTWGDSISNIDVPIKDGYTFSGWTLSGPGEYLGEDNEFTFGAGDATLTANWIASGGASTGYATYVTIDGHTYVFKGNDPTFSSPSVTMDLSVSSIDFSWNRGEHSISVPSNFLGLSTSEGGEITYLEGSSYTLSGGIGINRYYTFYSVVTSGDVYTSIITIDGQKFSFTSTTEQPAVLLEVTSTGAIMSYDSQVLTYTYAGDGNFLGLGFSQYMDPSFVVGCSYPLAAGSYTFKAVNDGAGSGEGPFETTIVIDGSVFQFFSDTGYPLVTCYIFTDRVNLVCGEDSRWWYSAYNEKLLGLSKSVNASEPDYRPTDEYFVVRGSSDEFIFQYYSLCVESSEFENNLVNIFRSTAMLLLVPVSVFFTAEFIPGLPLFSIMIVSLVLGLLFFLLKTSK